VGSFGGPGSIERVKAVAFGADQFVAVGTHYATGYAPDDELPPPEGRVWLSTDGVSWEPLSSPPGLEAALLTHLIVARDGSVLAFGGVETVTGASEPAVWRSHDGRTWERTDVGLPSVFLVSHVVSGAKGFVLSLRDQDGAERLWFSADGLAWETVDLPANVLGPIWDLGAGDDGFVALLEAFSGDAGITIASADGREWFLGEALPGFGALAPMAGDWITVVAPGVVQLPVDLEAWLSANGLDWSAVASIQDPEDRDTFGHPFSLVSVDGSVILTVALSIGGGVSVPAGVWSSPDGTVWDQLDFSPDALVTAGVEHDGTAVLTGYVGVDEGRATFWVNQRP
jgi:hypothetical protein